MSAKHATVREPKVLTIGDKINKLVAEFGNSTNGIYILERALQLALKMDTDLVTVGGKLIADTDTYKQIWDEETATIKRVMASIAADKAAKQTTTTN